MCHRFEMLSREEVDAAVDWLRAVRRALAGLGAGDAAAGAAMPPTFGRPAEFPLEALECYPGRECTVIAAEAAGGENAGGEALGAADDDLSCSDLVWGVEVPWQKPLVFNARIESALAGSGMWREAMEAGRCIVPVRAFYETRNVEVTDFRRPQYRFAATGGTALLLAGLRLGDRFVLVTCEPDAVVGHVHSRMPLSLTAPEALAWLDRSTDARDLLARHVPVPLESQEEPAPTKRPADPDQMSLF